MITIGEAIIIAVFTLVGYALIKTIVETEKHDK